MWKIVEVRQGVAERAFKDETHWVATSTRMPSAARPRAEILPHSANRAQ